MIAERVLLEVGSVGDSLSQPDAGDEQMRKFLLAGAAIALAGSMAHAQNDPGSLRNPAHHQNAAPTTASVDGCDCVTERPRGPVSGQLPASDGHPVFG